MRRLPVYLLVDTSGSMMGEPIESVRNGLQMLVSALRQDPYALETAYLSVITFDSYVNQVTPLTDLMSFQLPDIHANGLTSLGGALSMLKDCINREVKTSTETTKGDWKPVVFLLTDGLPTDDLQRGIDDIRTVKTGTFVACAAGAGADTNLLKTITETVVSLDTADANSIKQFFKWVSASISVSSQKVETNKGEVTGFDELPAPPKELNIVL